MTQGAGENVRVSGLILMPAIVAKETLTLYGGIMLLCYFFGKEALVKWKDSNLTKQNA